jgi:hypothetical protein
MCPFYGRDLALAKPLNPIIHRLPFATQFVMTFNTGAGLVHLSQCENDVSILVSAF